MAATEVRTIETAIHGRYLCKRTGSGVRPPLVVGFHGYGESAEVMMEPLERITFGLEDVVLVSVHALHRFYNTKTRAVVGSWMTSDDRELMIEDNVEYVSAIVDELRRELRGEVGPLIYVGFSQGTAMAYRAAALSGHECAGVVALAGDIPPDLTPLQLGPIRSAIVGLGSEDTWFTNDIFQRDVSRLEDAGCEVVGCAFDGGHEWADAFVKAATEFVARIASS